jgi:2-dehydro-3-deoxygluconokinase
MILGECMAELSAQDSGNYRLSFAGDVYNVAVYLQRQAATNTSTYFVTAVGTDVFSNKLLALCGDEDLDMSLALHIKGAHPGLYIIDTDADGERSFTYWRRESAARQMVTLLVERGGAAVLPDVDMVFFSGITLAILDGYSRAMLLDIVAALKQRGARVAFDPNYRPKLWQDISEARWWITRAYEISDIALPGFEDEQVLCGDTSPDDVITRIAKLGVAEIIVKCGDDAGVSAYSEGRRFETPIVRVKQVVDTTAAGDSFAGTYLAARLSGESPELACKRATKTAAYVIGVRGAIADKREFSKFMQENH